MRLRLWVCIALCLCLAAEVSAQQIDPLVANSTDPLELQQLGVQFIASNRSRDALAALRKALEIYPDNAETRMWLGVVYTQMNEDIAAEGEFRRALEINPQLTEVHNWFGVYWARRGNYDAAIAEYRKALSDPAYPSISRARVQVNLGNVLMQTGDHDEAVRQLSQAASVSVPSNDPLFALVNTSLADALVRTGRPSEALSSLARMEVLPANPRVEFLKGLAYRDLGEFQDARDHLGAVLRLAPGTDLASQALDALETLPDGS